MLLAVFFLTAFLVFSADGGKFFKEKIYNFSLTPDQPEQNFENNKETMEIKVYYSNSKLNETGDCDIVHPLAREIEKTESVAYLSLKELFKGPTESEKNEGYSSFFSKETEGILKSVEIKDETAYVNLTDIRMIIPNASSSCGSSQLLSQMENTLGQFPSVKRIIFAIEGDPEPFYEWLQLGCSSENDYCDKDPFTNKQRY